MLCHPHESPPHSDSVPFLVNHATTFYSRIAFAKHSLLMRIITRFKSELADVVSENPSLVQFVEAATAQLDTWASSIRTRRHVPPSDALASIQDSTLVSPPVMPNAANAIATTDDGNIVLGAQGSNPSSDLSNNVSVGTSNVGNNNKERWYFYQEKSSSNVFLHPLNHRVLSAEYGCNFDKALRNLEGIILQIDAFIMNDTLRKRYRFLDHLPDGCEFVFVELELTHLLSDHALAAHASEMKERHSARNKKKMAMAKETRRLEKEQSESLLKYFNNHGGIAGTSARSVSMDRNDRASFPALREENIPVPPARTRDEHNATGATEGMSCTNRSVGTGSPLNSTSNGWRADISSYSSVTSKMGLFPALGSSPRSVETLQGPWGSSSQSNTGVGSQPQKKSGPGSGGSEESRKGRKSHSKTILMSNAGSSHRR